MGFNADAKLVRVAVFDGVLLQGAGAVAAGQSRAPTAAAARAGQVGLLQSQVQGSGGTGSARGVRGGRWHVLGQRDVAGVAEPDAVGNGGGLSELAHFLLLLVEEVDAVASEAVGGDGDQVGQAALEHVEAVGDDKDAVLQQGSGVDAALGRALLSSALLGSQEALGGGQQGGGAEAVCGVDDNVGQRGHLGGLELEVAKVDLAGGQDGHGEDGLGLVQQLFWCERGQELGGPGLGTEGQLAEVEEVVAAVAVIVEGGGGV